MREPKQKPGFMKRFARDERGGILILFGLSVVFLTAIGGAAVDLGMQQLMRLKMQNALDAAVTSAASLNSCDVTITRELREQAVRRYFALNYPRQYANLAERPIPDVYEYRETAGGVAGQIGARIVPGAANTAIQTHFVSLFGQTTLAAGAQSRASLTDTYLDRNFDIVMNIDETGSMAWPVAGGQPSTFNPAVRSRADAARDSLALFVKYAFPDCSQPNPNARMGMVGFAGFLTNKWALSSDRTRAISLPAKIKPVGFNMEDIGLRGATNMLTNSVGADNEVSAAGKSARWCDGAGCTVAGDPVDYGYSAGYNVEASNGSADQTRANLTPSVTNTSNGYCGGSTRAGCSDLSRDLDTRVPTALLPLRDGRNASDPAYPTMSANRYMVFLSDGNVATNTTKAALDSECTRAKGTGVKIFAVNFTSANGDDRRALGNCSTDASDGTSNSTYYYNAPTEAELKQFLASIIKTVNKTKIVP